jgi:hypothetical protein
MIRPPPRFLSCLPDWKHCCESVAAHSRLKKRSCRYRLARPNLQAPGHSLTRGLFRWYMHHRLSSGLSCQQTRSLHSFWTSSLQTAPHTLSSTDRPFGFVLETGGKRKNQSQTREDIPKSVARTCLWMISTRGRIGPRDAWYEAS